MPDKNYRSSKDKSDKNYSEQPDLLEGEERKVHKEIVTRIIEGGAPSSPEAFARALKQWRRLPGSIVGIPVDSRFKTKESPKSSDSNQVSSETKTDTLGNTR